MPKTKRKQLQIEQVVRSLKPIYLVAILTKRAQPCRRSILISSFCSGASFLNVMHLKMHVSVGDKASGVTVTTANNDEMQDSNTDKSIGSFIAL